MFNSLRARCCAAFLSLLCVGGLAVAVAPSASADIPTNATISYAVFQLLNSERASNRLPALKSDPHLRAAAHGHNLAMAKYNTLSHQLPGEAVFNVRMANSGFRCSYCGENVAWNGNTSQAGGTALEVMMYNEKAPNNGHRLNILSPRFTYVGVDVIIDTAHGKLWLTEDFARP